MQASSAAAKSVQWGARVVLLLGANDVAAIPRKRRQDVRTTTTTPSEGSGGGRRRNPHGYVKPLSARFCAVGVGKVRRTIRVKVVRAVRVAAAVKKIVRGSAVVSMM